MPRLRLRPPRDAGALPGVREGAGIRGTLEAGPVESRPVKRRLFTILSALSLLLFVAVCVLWVRSYWIHDWTGYFEKDVWSKPGYVYEYYRKKGY